MRESKRKDDKKYIIRLHIRMIYSYTLNSDARCGATVQLHTKSRKQIKPTASSSYTKRAAKCVVSAVLSGMLGWSFFDISPLRDIHRRGRKVYGLKTKMKQQQRRRRGNKTRNQKIESNISFFLLEYKFSMHALNGHLIYSPDREFYSLNVQYNMFRVACNNLKHSADFQKRKISYKKECLHLW